MSLGPLLVEIVATALYATPLAVSVWALLDCAHRPAWAWALAGRNRVLWMVVILCGILSVIGGLLISVYYLVRVRPHVAAAEHGRFDDLGLDAR